MRRLLKKQRTWVGRLFRELKRQLDTLSGVARENADHLLGLAERLFKQLADPKATSKLYSLHEPEVDCISKGKARKRYEFGCKVGIASTQREGFVVGIRSFPGDPYDGHTLDELLSQVETLSATAAKTIAVDLGYRGRYDTTADIIHRGRKLTTR